MTILDRFLQQRRIQKAISYIPEQSVVLDIGCHRGELFTRLGNRLRYGVGIDPVLENDTIHEKYELIKEAFPSTRAENKLYHCITMLAVLEHLNPDLQANTIQACYKLLHKEGVLIVTVPDKKADKILLVLQKLRLIKGMQLTEHYGFDILQIPGLFSNAGFAMVVHKKFQLGLNNLFVFKKRLC
ncbi:MAG: methyltransferase domain-containing protein [Chitinophagaceae bacterium]|nr:methyltransferase domain-containing protein [Chitinophagaceae bacterium]